jgi:hypothetical protein
MRRSIHHLSSPTLRGALVVLGALSLVSASNVPAMAADLPNCNTAETTPCFEMVWVNKTQSKMTFLDLNPTPPDPSDAKFYVLAPQTSTPQGREPIIHDHVADGKRPRTASHSASRADLEVHYHGYLVLCSAQGVSESACVPTMTETPQGMLPFAKTVDGHRLTSSKQIEAAASAGLVMLVDTGAVFIASVSGHEAADCD